MLLIDRVAGKIIHLVASVCVYPSVCLWALSCLKLLTLIFGMRVDLDFEGQGRRSNVNVKQ